MRTSSPLFLFPLLVLTPVHEVAAQDLSGLYSRDGIEVRADERLFTLMALFNALGYDREVAAGPPPLEAPQYGEVRATVRRELQTKGCGSEEALALVAAQPRPLAEYVEGALLLGPPPLFSASEAPKFMAEWSGVLAKFHATCGAESFARNRLLLREAAKGRVAWIDAIGDGARKLLRVTDEDEVDLAEWTEEGPRLVVLINPLDQHGTMYFVRGEDVEYVVTGPVLESVTESTDAVLIATIANLLGPAVNRVASKLGEPALRKGLSTRGQIPRGWKADRRLATAMLAQAFAARALNRDLAWNKMPGAARSQGLEKAAHDAVAWYVSQGGGLVQNADRLVGRFVSIKVPGGESKP